MKRLFKKTAVFVIILNFCFAITSFQANKSHAIDRKVLLVFKTAGYGAAAGLLVGAATWTLGLGTGRNLFTGASLGLYAGIGLGVYILMTQEEKDRYDRNSNPWSPRTPVGPDDWKNEEEDPMEGAQLRLEYNRLNGENYFLTSVNSLGAPQEVKFWMPIASINLN